MLRLIGILAAAAVAGAASAQSTNTKSSTSSRATLSQGGGTATVTVDGAVVENQSFPSGTSKVTVQSRTRTGQAPEWTIKSK